MLITARLFSTYAYSNAENNRQICDELNMHVNYDGHKPHPQKSKKRYHAQDHSLFFVFVFFSFLFSDVVRAVQSRSLSLSLSLSLFFSLSLSLSTAIPQRCRPASARTRDAGGAASRRPPAGRTESPSKWGPCTPPGGRARSRAG